MNNDYYCIDCGKQYETWVSSTLCCEPKRTNKRATSDGRCTVCNRFTPAGFGCHGDFIADSYAAVVERRKRRSQEKQALMDAVKSDKLIAKLSRNEQKAMRATFIQIL